MSEMNIYNYLRKLTSAEEKEYDTEHKIPADGKGVVNDGYGNLYVIPTKGTTSAYSIVDEAEENGITYEDHYKYRYNFGTNEVELFVLDDEDGADDVDNYMFIDSYPISAENFIDGPEYWVHVAIDSLRDELEAYNTEFEAKEAYELYGEIIDEDKENYTYEITTEVEFQLMSDDWDFISKYEDNYADFINKYEKTDILYGETYEVTAKFDPETYTVVITIKFSMPLTKEELLDIYDEVLEEINVNFDNYTVTLSLSNIQEV